MKRPLLSSVIFLVIFALLFSAVQAVLTPDHNENHNIWYSLHGFDNLDSNSIEVLYLGASHTTLDVSPMKLYEDEQICSYCLSTPG